MLIEARGWCGSVSARRGGADGERLTRGSRKWVEYPAGCEDRTGHGARTAARVGVAGVEVDESWNPLLVSVYRFYRACVTVRRGACTRAAGRDRWCVVGHTGNGGVWRVTHRWSNSPQGSTSNGLTCDDWMDGWRLPRAGVGALTAIRIVSWVSTDDEVMTHSESDVRGADCAPCPYRIAFMRYTL